MTVTTKFRIRWAVYGVETILDPTKIFSECACLAGATSDSGEAFFLQHHRLQVQLRAPLACLIRPKMYEILQCLFVHCQNRSWSEGHRHLPIGAPPCALRCGWKEDLTVASVDGPYRDVLPLGRTPEPARPSPQCSVDWDVPFLVVSWHGGAFMPFS